MNKDKVNVYVNPNAPEYFKNFMQELFADMEETEPGSNTKFGRVAANGRSEPGKGDDVYLSVMGPPQEFQDNIVTALNGVCCISSINEDYANCMWPIVLKIKPGTDQQFVVRALREYANSIESSVKDEFPSVDRDRAMRDLQPAF